MKKQVLLKILSLIVAVLFLYQSIGLADVVSSETLAPACAITQILPVKDSGWITAKRRIGIIGRFRREKFANLNALFGDDNLRIAFEAGGKILSEEEVLKYYEEAYFKHLDENPDIVRYLGENARDVYDSDPEKDLSSGTDYNIQNSKAKHIQDIVIRRYFQSRNLKFLGEKFIRVHSYSEDSIGKLLSPFYVPFHRQDLIPEQKAEGRWNPGSVEDFYQSTKVVQVKTSVVAEMNDRIVKLSEVLSLIGVEIRDENCECFADAKLVEMLEKGRNETYERSEAEKEQMELAYTVLKEYRKGRERMYSKAHTFSENQLYEAVLDFVGVFIGNGASQEEVDKREAEAKGYLAKIFQNEKLKSEFILFLLKYKNSFRYKEKLTIPALSIANILLGRTVKDKRLVDKHRGELKDNPTLAQSPVFGDNVYTKIPTPEEYDERLPIDFTGQDKIRICALGANGSMSGPGMFAEVRKVLRMIPDLKFSEIEIVVMDTQLFDRTIEFPEEGGYKEVHRLLEGNRWIPPDNVSRETKITFQYRKIDESESSQNLAKEGFSTEETFNVVLSIGAENYFAGRSGRAADRFRQNQFKLLSAGGVLISDGGRTDSLDIYVKNNEGHTTLEPVLLPCQIYYEGLSREEGVLLRDAYARIGTSRIVTDAFNLATLYQTHENPLIDRKFIAHLLSIFEGEFIPDQVIAAVLLQGVPRDAINRMLLIEDHPILAQYLEDFELILSTPQRANLVQTLNGFYKVAREETNPFVVSALNGVPHNPNECVSFGKSLKIEIIQYQGITFFRVIFYGQVRYFSSIKDDDVIAKVFSPITQQYKNEFAQCLTQGGIWDEAVGLFSNSSSFAIALIRPYRVIAEHGSDSLWLSRLSEYLSRIADHEAVKDGRLPLTLEAVINLKKLVDKRIIFVNKLEQNALLTDPNTLLAYFSGRDRATAIEMVHEFTNFPRHALERASLDNVKGDGTVERVVQGYDFNTAGYTGNEGIRDFGMDKYFQRLIDYRPYYHREITGMLDDIRKNERNVEIHRGTHNQTLANLKGEGCTRVLEYFPARPLFYLDRPMQYQMYVAFFPDHTVRYVFRTALEGRTEHMQKTLFLCGVKAKQVVSKYFPLDHKSYFIEKLKALVAGRNIKYYLGGTLGFIKGFMSERLGLFNLIVKVKKLLQGLDGRISADKYRALEAAINKLNEDAKNDDVTNKQLWVRFSDIERKAKSDPDLRGLAVFSNSLNEYQGRYKLNDVDNLFHIKMHMMSMTAKIEKIPGLNNDRRSLLNLIKKRFSERYFLEQMSIICEPPEAILGDFKKFMQFMIYCNNVEELISLFPEAKGLKEYRILEGIRVFSERIKTSIGGEFGVLSVNNEDGQEENILFSHILFTRTTPALTTALADLGLEKILFTGSAGAFVGKGIKVGDIIIPAWFQMQGKDGKMVMNERANAMLEGLDPDNLPQGVKIVDLHGHADSMNDENAEWIDKLSEEGFFTVDQEGCPLMMVSTSANVKIGIVFYVSDLMGRGGDSKLEVEERQTNFSNPFMKRLRLMMERAGLGASWFSRLLERSSVDSGNDSTIPGVRTSNRVEHPCLAAV